MSLDLLPLRIRTELISPLQNLNLPKKVKKEIEKVKSKYPQEIRDYGDIGFENELHTTPYDDIREDLKKTRTWFKKVRKRMRKEAVSKLGMKIEDCEVEGSINFHYKRKDNITEIEVIKIEMSLGLQSKFYGMQKLFEKTIGIDYDKQKISQKASVADGYRDKVEMSRSSDIIIYF